MQITLYYNLSFGSGICNNLLTYQWKILYAVIIIIAIMQIIVKHLAACCSLSGI